mmetsp:Transcript_28370/g.65604  ORF Transcript_28370/g.65604 Transcript_28370/m.65604 type:complete len:425 (+) Transcript_28370:107-1381(+)
MAENQDDFAYAEFFAPETWPEKIPRTGTRITTAENRLGHRPIGTYDLPRWVKHPDVQKPVMQLHPEDYMGNKKSFNAAGWNVAHVGAQCSMFTGEGIRMLSKATKDEINAPDLAEGWTPLHWAVYGDHGVVCEALLLAKADPLKKAGSQPAAMELLAVNDGDSEAREVFDRLVLAKLKQQLGTDTTEGDVEEEPPLEQRGAWVAFKDAVGVIYYWNRRDNTTVWKLPSAARVAWYAFRRDSGTVYYWHARKQQTVWNLPLMYKDDLSSDDGSEAGIQHTVIGIPRQQSTDDADETERDVPPPPVPQHQAATDAAPGQKANAEVSGPTVPPTGPPPSRPPRRAPAASQQKESESKTGPEEADEATDTKQSTQASELQADIAKAILAEDELGLEASIEMARGILEGNSLAEALAALEEVKQRARER